MTDKETLQDIVRAAYLRGFNSVPSMAMILPDGTPAAHWAGLDAVIATMLERLRTPSLRCEPANGATLKEMRENLSTELKDAGDCRLVWVNEGDLAMLTAFQQENSDAD